MKLFKRRKEILENAWDKYYPKDKRTIETPDMSIYSYFEKTCFNRRDKVAINYFGSTLTFQEFLNKIDLCAKSLISHGVRANDVVTICMPNTPEAIIMFYAVNKIGAISNLIHPLSSKEEIKDSIIKTNSVFLLLININYEKIKDVIEETNVYKTIVVSAKESMPKLLGLGYYLTNDIKLNFKSNEIFISWEDFIQRGKNYNKNIELLQTKDKDALYLHSGGTTGTPKNIVLTNGNLNALIEQAKIVFPDLGVGDNFLSILPIFHCFGLVVCILAPLALGCTITLIPQFDAKRFDKLIRKYNPSVLIGVPTLFEALMTNPYMLNVSLENIKYVVSGGDTLTPEKNLEVNKFLQEHNCDKHVIQGYGMTETTGPSTFGSYNSDKLGSVGIPLPGNKIRIEDINTKEILNNNEIGEICIKGPTVMSRYLDDQEETNKLIIDDWVHTGDLGYMDEDGVLFYVQRLKRMLIVSGYNVYPSHIENIIMKHKYVKLCGVIGVPHPYKVQVPIAYIILEKGIENNHKNIKEIEDYLKDNLSKYMIPKKIIVKEELPKTMVGKIDYKLLEREYNNE